MPISSTKPPFILAYIADSMGCGFQRIMMPMGALASAGLIEGTIRGGGAAPAELLALAPDVVVWQRQLEEGQIAHMAEARKTLPNAHFVYELDDYLVGVPDASYHADFMPPGIAERMERAIALCDSCSTTTDEMAEWLRGMGGKDVRVIANLVPGIKVREQPERKPGAKLRVGFGGGISHKGDLELIRPAMAAIGDAVEWVFIGMQPENPPVPVEYHNGVPPANYLDALFDLRMDLILAPLEDNHFNRCKSNLRLVEGGACDAAIIAQNLPTYHVDKPPVWAHVDAPDDWTREIRRFIDAAPFERRRSARAMRVWVGRHYSMEAKLPDRLRAWLPSGAVSWRPTQPKPPEGLVICCAADAPMKAVGARLVRRAARVTTLAEACAKSVASGDNVLWLRPGTEVSESAWEKLHDVVTRNGDAAAAIPIGPDGPNAFPRKDMFTAIPPAFADLIDADLGRRWPGRTLSVGLLAGACVLLRGAAVAVIGAPDVEGCGGNEEAALVEWGARAINRQQKLYQAADAYVGTLGGPPQMTQALLHRAQVRGIAEMMQKLTEPFADADREAVELSVLSTQWSGLRPGMAGLPHDYPTWSALQATRHGAQQSGGMARVKQVMLGDERPESINADEIDDWFVFTDRLTRLREEALQVFQRAIAETPNAAVIYSDHEVVMQGQLVPWFKGVFDYERFLQQDYVTHCMAVRNPGRWPKTRVDLYELVLAETGANWRDNIVHTPHVLAVSHEGDPEMRKYFVNQQQAIVERHLEDENVELSPFTELPGCLRLKRRVPKGQQPAVEIIILTTGDMWMLEPCLKTLIGMTAYENYTVNVIANNLKMPYAEFKTRVAELAPDAYFAHDINEFNWAAMNNRAAKRAETDFFCFLNDDTRILGPDWLERMVAQAIQPDVGAVGAKLSFPAGMIQHIGVVCNKGIAGHIHIGQPLQQTGYWNIAALSHENIAVTGACMVVSREKFEEVGGFDERYAHNYNDVVFCWELYRRGYRNVVEINAELQHVGGVSRTAGDQSAAQIAMQREHAQLRADYGDADPYWSPNNGLGIQPDGFTIAGLNCDLLTWEDDPALKRGAPRVLVINDMDGVTGPSFNYTKAGWVVINADVHDSTFTMTAPTPANVQGWSLRNIASIRRMVETFGCEKIVLCGLVGHHGPATPVDALRALKRLGVPVEHVPRDAERVCPKLNMMRDGKYCGEAWREGAATCQRCVDDFDGPLGPVDVQSYRQAWIDLLGFATPEARDEAAD